MLNAYCFACLLVCLLLLHVGKHRDVCFLYWPFGSSANQCSRSYVTEKEVEKKNINTHTKRYRVDSFVKCPFWIWPCLELSVFSVSDVYLCSCFIPLYTRYYVVAIFFLSIWTHCISTFTHQDFIILFIYYMTVWYMHTYVSVCLPHSIVNCRIY